MITTTTKHSTVFIYPFVPLELDFGSSLKPMTDDEFFDFCQRHKDLRIEMNKDGEIIIMPPTFSETGARNFELAGNFWLWAKQDGTGKSFDSSAGFILPNGAKRSPDLSWIRLERWSALPSEQRKKFAPLCPDFVVELRSESDTLSRLQDKMTEYIENGAQLGWLIDPIERRVYVYRPNVNAETLDDPQEVSGEPLLKGFVLKMKEIWE